MHVPSFSLWLTRLYITMQSSEQKYHPAPRLFETVIPNWTLFSCCQSCGMVLQGLPRLKGKDVADVRSLSLTSLLLLTMRITLQSPFIFPIRKKGADQRRTQKIMQPCLCHTLWGKVIGAVCDVHRCGALLWVTIASKWMEEARGFISLLCKKTVLSKLCKDFFKKALKQFPFWTHHTEDRSESTVTTLEHNYTHKLQTETNNHSNYVGHSWQSCKCGSLIHYCDVEVAFAVVSKCIFNQLHGGTGGKSRLMRDKDCINSTEIKQWEKWRRREKVSICPAAASVHSYLNDTMP